MKAPKDASKRILSRAVTPPLLPIQEKVVPDKWLNIPICLTRAFQDSVENQIYLEKLAADAIERAERSSHKCDQVKDLLVKEIQRNTKAIKDEINVKISTNEVKIKSSITEVRNSLETTQ